jgi:hypothetical protein
LCRQAEYQRQHTCVIFWQPRRHSIGEVSLIAPRPLNGVTDR